MASTRKTQRVRPVVRIDVDLQAWADTYGISVEEARSDCQGHLQELVDHAVRQALELQAAGATLAEAPSL